MVVRVMGMVMVIVMVMGMVIKLQIQFEQMNQGFRGSRFVRIICKCKICNMESAERFHISSVGICHRNDVLKLLGT